MDKIGRQLTSTEWINLAGEAARSGLLYLLLTGGEPLLREDFEEIYTALCQMGFIITLNTNATLITPTIIKLFSKYPPTVTEVTLYGASPETYGRLCGDEAGYDKVLRGLEHLSKLPTVLEVRTTLVKENADELDQLRAIAEGYSKRFRINTHVYKAVRGAVSNAEACRLTPVQIAGILRTFREHGHPSNDAIVQASEPGEEPIGRNIEPTALPCLAAKASFWITWDGKMLPCGMFSQPYTRPLSEGFAAAWNRLPGPLADISKPKDCRYCTHSEACTICPALLQAETGSTGGISPYLCSFVKG